MLSRGTAESERNLKVLAETPALRRFAQSLTRDRTVADDLVQETLARGLGAWAGLKDPARVRPWLFAILHNQWRQNHRTQRPSEPLDEAADVAVAPEQPGAAFQSQVLRALDGLPAEQAVVIRLIAVDDLAYQEVADLLGIPIGTVMSRLSRGRARLRELLSDSTVVPFRRPS